MNEWERVSERLRRQFGDGTTIYTNWLEPLQFLAVVGGRLRLAAPNAEVRDYVQDRYAQSILSTAADLGLGITSVELEVDEQPVPDPPLVQHRSTMRSVAVDTLWDPVRGGGGDIAFMHAFLAQVGLPRKHMRNLDGSQAIRYERRSGNCAFLVQAGEIDNGKGFVLQPIPYGPKPRLMLVDICTRAVRDRSPEVGLESSVRAYLTKRLDVGWGGGRNGQYTLFRKQALALAACSMRFAVERGDRVIQFQGMPISQFEAWVVSEGEQQPLWPGSLRLSAEFYGSLIDHGLPLDMRAYRALGHSALAMDIYAFLAHRLWRIRDPVEISWRQLRDAMGPEYADVRDFRRKFLDALKAVQAVYPESKGKAQPIRGRLRLYRADPPVAPLTPRGAQRPGG